jgi:hypothetical protein
VTVAICPSAIEGFALLKEIVPLVPELPEVTYSVPQFPEVSQTVTLVVPSCSPVTVIVLPEMMADA